MVATDFVMEKKMELNKLIYYLNENKLMVKETVYGHLKEAEKCMSNYSEELSLMEAKDLGLNIYQSVLEAEGGFRHQVLIIDQRTICSLEGTKISIYKRHSDNYYLIIVNAKTVIL